MPSQRPPPSLLSRRCCSFVALAKTQLITITRALITQIRRSRGTLHGTPYVNDANYIEERALDLHRVGKMAQKLGHTIRFDTRNISH